MPCLAKGYSSCLPIGSKESNGCQPHLDSTIYLATSSIHGERHSGPCCSSTKHQGDLSWMPLQSVDSGSRNGLAAFLLFGRNAVAALQDEASACAELDAAPRMAASSLAFLFLAAISCGPFALACADCFSFRWIFSFANGLETFEKERFCSFPHRHGINDTTTTRRRPDDDAPTRRRRDEPLEANKGPAPRPPDYKREPFAAHSGKKGLSGMNIQNHQITSSTPSTYPQPGILHANSDKLRDLIRKWVTYPNSRVPMRSC